MRGLRLRPVLSVLLCLFLTAASVADAFSVRWDRPASSPQRYDGPDEVDFDGPLYKETTQNGSGGEENYEQ